MEGVMPYINSNLDGFILKILTPTDLKIITALERIRTITGRGNLYLSSYSRQSTMEMYFISTPPGESVSAQARKLLMDKWKRALNDQSPHIQEIYREHMTYRQNIVEDVNLLDEIDMSKSIEELGPQIAETPRPFLHWKSLGVYPFGNRGGKSTFRSPIVWNVIKRLITIIHGLSKWSSTDTTPEGFMKVFVRKVDKPPTENSPYFIRLREVYEGLADHMMNNRMHLNPLSWDEIKEQANRQGAPGIQDLWKDVGQALDTPEFMEEIRQHERALINGKPLGGVFNTIGKREKKEEGGLGSRMVAYLKIPMRMIELKYFGRLINMTKPKINRFGVGGLGLHDLGMRLKEIYGEWSISDDIAGYDTKIGKKILSLEFYHFVSRFATSPSQYRIMENLYRIYAHPHILIPYPSFFNRCELIEGVGQRMSGSATTYAMNTITRIAIGLLQICDIENIGLEEIRAWVTEQMLDGEWSGCVSGDDAVFTSSSENIRKLSRRHDVLNSIGMTRKNIPREAPSPIGRTFEEVEFCSHKYAKISYYDSYSGEVAFRYQPIRSVAEIFAKASIWLSSNDVANTHLAWVAAQANNLLINYGHMRDCRRLGLALKSIVPDNVVLGLNRVIHLPRPWISDGHYLEIMNECLFGKSTAYPFEGFVVRTIGHMGYIDLETEQRCNTQFGTKEMLSWRRAVPEIVAVASREHGGNGKEIESMSRYSTGF